MEESEGLRSKLKKIYKGIPKTLKLILIIIISVIAFIIIIAAAWKQKLLKVTSGEIKTKITQTFCIASI